MTLEEAIKHCEEVAADLESETDEVTELYDDCECREEHLQLAEWLTELKDLREENKVLISECDRLIKEKGELLSKVSGGDVLRICQLEEQLEKAKRLLKAAVEDMTGMQFGEECKVCCKKLLPNECPIHNNVACILEKDFKWRYAAEALALIGEDTNVPATATDINFGGKMRVNYEGDGYDDDGNIIYDTAYCPKCGQEYEVDYDNHDNYCRNCGQALDWSTDGGADGENN